MTFSGQIFFWYDYTRIWVKFCKLLFDFIFFSNIKVVPVGMSRNLKKLVVQAKIPDLSKLNDISDYVHR